MNYTIYYKLKNSFFWKKIKNVKGDGLMETNTHRWFITNKEIRYEVPLEGTLFKFSVERFMLIRDNTEKQIGTKLPL